MTPQKPTALITQASSPLGLAFAELLAQLGHPLVLVARNTENLHHVAHTIQTRHHIRVDVLTHELGVIGAGESLAMKVQARGHRIGVLINNAGVAAFGGFSSLALDRQLGMLDLNVRTLTEITHQLLPGMLEEQQGWILNVASSAVFHQGPQMVVYHASQAYLVHFSEALNHEVHPLGVKVLALCPGPATARTPSGGDHLEFPTMQDVATEGLRLLFASSPESTPKGQHLMVEAFLDAHTG